MMTDKALIQRSKDSVQQKISSYKSLSEDATTADKRRVQYKELVSNYYTLVNDITEYAWGRSFHFANRFQGETLAESLQRHESYLAMRMQLKPGDKVLDIGCGVGGPLRRIAYLSNAHITGVSICEYQIQRAKIIGVPDNCKFIYGDFMELPFDDNSFDHIYAIEAVWYAPNKTKCLAEIQRVLKLGGSFAGYDCGLTDVFDPHNKEHVETQRLIEESTGVPELQPTKQLFVDLKSVGFKVEDSFTLPEADIPWYQPFKGDNSYWSISNYPRAPLGRWIIRCVMWLMEKTRIFPQGTVDTVDLADKGAIAMIRGGETKIFTPFFFFLARKIQ